MQQQVRRNREIKEMLHVSFPLSLLTTYIIDSDTKPLLIEYNDPFTENPNTQTQDTWKQKKFFEEKTLREKPSRILCRKSNNNLIRNKF